MTSYYLKPNPNKMKNVPISGMASLFLRKLSNRCCLLIMFVAMSWISCSKKTTLNLTSADPKIVSIDSVSNYDVIHGTGMIDTVGGYSVTFKFNVGVQILDTIWSDGTQSFTHLYTVYSSNPVSGIFQQVDDDLDYSTAIDVPFTILTGEDSIQVQVNASHVNYSPNQSRMAVKSN